VISTNPNDKYRHHNPTSIWVHRRLPPRLHPQLAVVFCRVLPMGGVMNYFWGVSMHIHRQSLRHLSHAHTRRRIPLNDSYRRAFAIQSIISHLYGIPSGESLGGQYRGGALEWNMYGGVCVYYLFEFRVPMVNTFGMTMKALVNK